MSDIQLVQLNFTNIAAQNVKKAFVYISDCNLPLNSDFHEYCNVYLTEILHLAGIKIQLTITKQRQHVDFTVILCEPKLVLILAAVFGLSTYIFVDNNLLLFVRIKSMKNS